MSIIIWESTQKSITNPYSERLNLVILILPCLFLPTLSELPCSENVKFLAPQIENPNCLNLNGWTSLHIAAKDGSTEIFKFLAHKVENPSGFTPFQTAAQYGSTEIFKFLGTSSGKFSLLADWWGKPAYFSLTDSM